MSDFYSTFSNPFMGLPADFGGLSPPPDWAAVPVPSTEAMVGGFVNPLAPGSSESTVEGTDVGAAADTDKGRKASSLQQVLKGVQSPAAPQQQKISSPSAPQMKQVNSQLATVLASMGVTPAQLLRLSEAQRGR